MSPNNPYREKARSEVQTWIELDRVGGLIPELIPESADLD